MIMVKIKFRLRSPIDKIVGYERWYSGSLDSKNFWTAKPCWLYSKDGKMWSRNPIEHRFKDSFIGIKDKRGKEIFEGDELMYIGTSQSSMVVKFKDSCFCGEGLFNTLPLIDYLNAKDFISIEVIGNIYENKEILTNAKKETKD